MQRLPLKARNLPTKSFQKVRTLATNPPTQPPTKEKQKEPDPIVTEAEKSAQTQSSTKTMAEKDAELMSKLANISGEGGESGVEYEDGKASAMKRSVKNNMFRLI